MFTKKRLLSIIILAAVICAGLIIALKFQRQPSSNTLLEWAHAQTQGSTTGCATCHTQPIVADCTSCHPQPPTLINGTAFPHHDTTGGSEAPNNCQLSLCHDGVQNDARYAINQTFNHTYCENCHGLEHTAP